MMDPWADQVNADEPLIHAVQSRDRTAFDEFVRRNERTVRGVIFGVLGRRDPVDDVAQQVWTTVWQRIGELRDVRSWRSWLCRIAHNSAIDAGRHHSRRAGFAERLPDDVVDPRLTTGEVRGADRDRERRMLDAIRGLPAIYREPFVLRHLNDWSYQQIAEVMGLPLDSVETRLVRARRLLREALGSLQSG